MNVSTLLGGPAGVRGVIIGTTEGTLVGSAGNAVDADNKAAVLAAIDRDLGKAGEALGLGVWTSLVIKSAQDAWVLGRQGDSLAMLELDRKHSTAEAEALLRDSAWTRASQPCPETDEVTESDVDILSEVDVDVEFESIGDEEASQPVSSDTHEHTEPAGGREPSRSAPEMVVPAIPSLQMAALSTPATQPKTNAPSHGATSARMVKPPPPPTTRRGDPVAARPLTAHLVPVDANILDDSWDVDEVLGSLSLGPVELRRALAQGDVRKAETISVSLFGPLSDATGSSSNELEQADRVALDALVNGITAALAGDNRGALEQLRRSAMPAQAPSIRWATHLWLARAELSSGLNLEKARAEADMAVEMARQLDAEAEALSLCDLAEIEFARGAQATALSHALAARQWFAPLHDEANLARVQLLEARILAALGQDAESRVAAEQAHLHHASWPPPLLFMAQCALEAGEFHKAEVLVQPLLAKSSRPPLVAHMGHLLDMVRNREMTAQEANHCLSLMQAQPSPETLRELEEIAERFSQHLFLSEALGWMLLRAGDYNRASERFNALAHATELSSDERSSVLLALGCLATVRSRHEKPNVKLREAMLAVPDELRSNIPTRPAPPSPVTASRVAPIEIGSLERQLPSVGIPIWAKEARTSPRATTHGPVFAGSLRLLCLPDLLDFLRTGRRTGTLVCASDAGIGAIQLKSGLVTGAACPTVSDIGEWLVARGLLSSQALCDAVNDQKEQSSKNLLGTILIERKLVKPEMVREALEAQIVATIRELITWVDGQFAFDPEAVVEPPISEVHVELDPQAILLNLFKEMDEAQR